MPKKRTDHVVCGKDELQQDFLQCNSCGERLVYKLPLKVDTWVNMSRSFIQSHSNCKPKPTLTDLEMKHGVDAQ